MSEWIDVPNLKQDDKVIIGYRKVVIGECCKLPTGDYDVWWTYTRSDGNTEYGGATILAVTSLQVW
jgi:hypothetical protein